MKISAGGKHKWKCASNIAIVKYWGKKGNQIPCNASVSMTLSNAVTELELSVAERKAGEGVDLHYYFEGNRHAGFETRIKNYLEANVSYFPFLRNHSIVIHSTNSFPHSTGIASSASAFGALALALLDAQYDRLYFSDTESFLRKASELARLGSGSACRSIYGEFVSWGKHPHLIRSSDEYAIPVEAVHENFSIMKDAILIVDDNPKKVSSSLGHSLMKNHLFAENRFFQAQKHTEEIINTLSIGDYEKFIKIAESEALALHAMMMTSGDYYLLMKPGTIHAIEKIMQFRKDTHTPVCFTLDAGPNVHVIYPGSFQAVVEDFIENEIRPDIKEVIFDEMGSGPAKIY